MSAPHSIAAINQLPQTEKETIYFRFIPHPLLERFEISPQLTDLAGRSLIDLRARPGSTDVVLSLRHAIDARDPLLYAHLTDTMNGQIHVLLYIINDPHAERFNVDRLSDGSATQFGLQARNLAAEQKALQAGLAPGQVRAGLRILNASIQAFDAFVSSLGHQVYFIEPLFYHNAIIFERYGFRYQVGRRRMESLNQGFAPDGPLTQRLNGSTPFRQLGMQETIRGRSWALHDGIADEPFTHVTMYKKIGDPANLETFPHARW